MFLMTIKVNTCKSIPDLYYYQAAAHIIHKKFPTDSTDLKIKENVKQGKPHLMIAKEKGMTPILKKVMNKPCQT